MVGEPCVTGVGLLVLALFCALPESPCLDELSCNFLPYVQYSVNVVLTGGICYFLSVITVIWAKSGRKEKKTCSPGTLKSQLSSSVNHDVMKAD